MKDLILPNASTRWAEKHRTHMVQAADPAKAYAFEMWVDYQQLRPLLPAAPEVILDIGCGLGAIDVLLQRHYRAKGQDPQFILMDYAQGEANNLAATELFLRENGADLSRFTFIEPTDDETKVPDVDLVLSLLAWGHTIPIKAYFGFVSAVLKEGGRLMLDIRMGLHSERFFEQGPYEKIDALTLGSINQRKSMRHIFEKTERATDCTGGLRT